jgi:hypothetical protein
MLTDRNDGGWKAEKHSAQKATEADWFRRARDFKCAEESKTGPPSSVTVTLCMSAVCWVVNPGGIVGGYNVSEVQPTRPPFYIFSMVRTTNLT